MIFRVKERVRGIWSDYKILNEEEIIEKYDERVLESFVKNSHCYCQMSYKNIEIACDYSEEEEEIVGR